jgi:prepilin-type N-terminal cleavage/methylation domain-containing protein
MEYDERMKTRGMTGGHFPIRPPAAPRNEAPTNAEVQPFMDRRQTGFTLIELIAVMAIVALLMTLAVVGFTRTSRGRAIQSAVSEVHSALSLARQQAIAKGSPVIFLVCDQNFASRNITVPADLIAAPARSYAILDAASRQYLKGWTPLPAGVVFDTAATVSSDEQNVLNVGATPPPAVNNIPCLFTNIPFPSVEYTNWTASAPGVAFKSDGSMFFRSWDTFRGWRKLGLVEGLAPSNGPVRLVPNGQNNAVMISASGASSVQVP